MGIGHRFQQALRRSRAAVVLLAAALNASTPLLAAADEDTVEFARRHMRCDAWIEIHHAGGEDAKKIESWSVVYLRQVAHDFAVDVARKTGSRSENDDGVQFSDERVLAWLFLHCHDHPDDTIAVSAMNWSMALSLAAGPRPLPPY
jgi:hypothetical protein